jgi:hypothetical protein
MEREQIVQEVLEEVLRRIPDMLGHLIKNHALIMKLNKEFYSKNEELKGHEKDVAQVVQEYEDKYPQWEYAKILEEVPEVIKERLRMKEQILGQPSREVIKPRVVPEDLQGGNGLL